MNQGSNISIAGDELRIRFDRFDIENYRLFLKAKRLPEYRIETAEDLTYTITAPARFAGMLGIDLDPTAVESLPLPTFLYDDQTAVVRMALAAKRFAIWSDCGGGKTLDGLEFARQVVHKTGKRVLISTRNEIVSQWLDEARLFYGPEFKIIALETREDMKRWCRDGSADGTMIAVTNHDKFIHKGPDDQVVSELRYLGGFVLDEASILKTGGGKIKWALIKSAKGIEYKLALTATPAPNDYMEFSSQASFLEKLRNDNEIIWTYFVRDSKTHRWTIKQHARKAFFEFMAGWSIYIRDPRRYGWRLGVDRPPEPVQFQHLIELTREQRNFIIEFNAAAPPPANDRSGTPSMFAGEYNAITSNKYSQAAKGFIYTKSGENDRKTVLPVASLKPAFVADLIAKEVARGLQVLVWTEFDAETDILAKELAKHPKFKARFTRDLDILTGRTPKAERPQLIEEFRRGESRVLISRAKMLGYGMNFQNVGSMIFSGWTFSYEAFYQAVRRAFRHGQIKSLRVHIPVIPELEGQMLDAIGRKDRQNEAAIQEMENNYIAAMSSLRGRAA